MAKFNVISGGFDPLTEGHAALFKHVAEQGGAPIIVILNSDEWLKSKKGKPFMPFEARKVVMQSLKGVVTVVPQIDTDKSVAKTLRFLCDCYPNDKLTFINAGDRKSEETPEYKACKDIVNLQFADWDTVYPNAHSSNYLKDWAEYKNDTVVTKVRNNTDRVNRPWGFWKVLDRFVGAQGLDNKIKILNVAPNQKLSMQRHENRHEFWLVIQGQGALELDHVSGKGGPTSLGRERVNLHEGKAIKIFAGVWHQLRNNGTKPLIVLEHQVATAPGLLCEEEDIVRWSEDRDLYGPGGYSERYK